MRAVDGTVLHSRLCRHGVAFARARQRSSRFQPSKGSAKGWEKKKKNLANTSYPSGFCRMRDAVANSPHPLGLTRVHL
jgi:hypothetical protein